VDAVLLPPQKKANKLMKIKWFRCQIPPCWLAGSSPAGTHSQRVCSPAGSPLPMWFHDWLNSRWNLTPNSPQGERLHSLIVFLLSI